VLKLSIQRFSQAWICNYILITILIILLCYCPNVFAVVIDNAHEKSSKIKVLHEPGAALIKLKKPMTSKSSFRATYDSLSKYLPSAQKLRAILIKNKSQIKPVFKYPNSHERKIPKTGKNQIQKGVELERRRLVKVTFPTDEPVKSFCKEVLQTDEVEFCEPNHVRNIDLVPNDAEYDQQWYLPHIRAEEAWDIPLGNANIVIAVIDTGVDYNHVDLSNNMWSNPCEVPSNGVDDPCPGDAVGNGLIDDVIGYDFVEDDPKGICAANEDCSMSDADPNDLHGHGTHVSGIAAATTNNTAGIAGVCPNCKIMALRAGFLNIEEGGSLYDDHILAALEYALENNVDVINMSFSGPYNQSYIDIFIRLNQAGAILIAAAGNSASNGYRYPAGFPEVIAVGATDSIDRKAYFSNFGENVDVVAPGVDIMSTLPNGNYSTKSGTSMSSPIVAGVAGLILSQDPTLNTDALRTILRGTGEPVDPTDWDGRQIGRIDAFRALTGEAPLEIQAFITSPSILEGNPNGEFYGQVGFGDAAIIGTADAVDINSYRVDVSRYGLSPAWESRNISLVNGGSQLVHNDVLATWNTRDYEDGRYMVRLQVFNQQLEMSESIANVTLDRFVKAGWPKLLESETTNGGPIITDLDNDNDLEIAMATDYGNVYAWHHDGTSVTGWPIHLNARAQLAIGDLDNNDLKEFVISYEYRRDNTSDVRQFDSTPFEGMHQFAGDDIGILQRITSLFDLTGDGQLEIMWAHRQNAVWAWNTNGEPVAGWDPLLIPGTSSHNVSRPAVGNFDDDPELELVFTQNPKPNPSGNHDVIAYAVNSDGTAVWEKPFMYRGGGEPVAGNLDRDPNDEVVIVSRVGVHAIDSDGTLMWEFIPGSLTSIDNRFKWTPYPVLADLDLDGVAEVIVGGASIGAGLPELWVFRGSDGTNFDVNWPYSFGFDEPVYFNGVVVANVDDDPEPEIITIVGDNSGDVSLYIFNPDGSILPGTPRSIGVDKEYFGLFNGHYPQQAVPAVGDLDGDGILELIPDTQMQPWVPTSYAETPWRTFAYVYNLGIFSDGDFEGERDIPWPMRNHNPENTGHLTPSNALPFFDMIPNQTAVVGEEVALSIHATDFQEHELIYTMTEGPSNATFDHLTRLFTWTPTIDQLGYQNVMFETTNGTYTQSMTILFEIVKFNQSPILERIGNQTAMANRLLEFTLSATDINLFDELEYFASNLPDGALFDPITQIFSWLPDDTHVGVHTHILFEVDDGTNLVSETINITVTPFENLSPILDAESLAMLNNLTVGGEQTTRINLVVTDPDGNPITYQLGEAPSFVTTESTDDPNIFTLVLNPGPTDMGVFNNAELILSDGLSTPNKINFNVIVNGIPNFNFLDFPTHFPAGQELTFDVTVTDPEGEIVVPEVSSHVFNLGATFDVEGNVGRFSWTPQINRQGFFGFSWSAQDSFGNVRTHWNFLQIGPPNDPPTFSQIPAQIVKVENELSFDVLATDPEGANLRYYITDIPVNSSFDLNTQQFSWTPTTNDIGNHTISLGVTDGFNHVPIEISVEVLRPNQPPTLDLPGQGPMNQGTNLVLSGLTVGDADGGQVTVRFDVTTEKLDVPAGKITARLLKRWNFTISIIGKTTTLTGDVNAINNFLTNPGIGYLVYQPTLTHSGITTLHMTIDDGEDQATASIDIEILTDATPPMNIIVTPRDGSVVSQNSFLLKGIMSDNDGIKDVLIDIYDNKLNQLIVRQQHAELDMNSGTWKFEVDGFTLDTDNTYLLTAVAEDLTGNITSDSVSVTVGLKGDFNNDRVVNQLDIDLIQQEKLSGNYTTLYDLTGDGMIDNGDIDYMIHEVLGTYPGDVDLDGMVGNSDILILADYSGKSNSTHGWSQGDFNGDDVVDDSDLKIIKENWHKGMTNSTDQSLGRLLNDEFRSILQGTVHEGNVKGVSGHSVVEYRLLITYPELVFQPDGKFVYTPSAGFTGQFSFRYQAIVFDDYPLDEAKVFITVKPDTSHPKIKFNKPKVRHDGINTYLLLSGWAKDAAGISEVEVEGLERRLVWRKRNGKWIRKWNSKRILKTVNVLRANDTWSYELPVKPKRRYIFRARAIDSNGNASRWMRRWYYSRKMRN